MFVQFIIFIDVIFDMKIYNEEIFGLVLLVIKYSDVEDVIDMVNDSCYGLFVGVWIGDFIVVQFVSYCLEVGIVWVNDWYVISGDMFFGGIKQSGYGWEINIVFMEGYLEIKNYVISFEIDLNVKVMYGLVYCSV